MKIGLLFALFVLILILGIVNNVFGWTSFQRGLNEPTRSTNALMSHDEIELLFYSAPQPLDWSSPNSLVQSAVHNTLTPVWGPSSLVQKFGDNFQEAQTSSEGSNSAQRTLSQEELLSVLQERVDSNGRDLSESASAGSKSRDFRFHPHPISHLNVRVHCSGTEEEILGSTSAESSAATLRKLLLEKAGMETLIENVRGSMYSTQQVKKWLSWMRETGGVHSIKYKVSPDLCRYVKGFLRAYDEAGHSRIYGGLQAEPFKGEGAGCAAFGMSFLKAAGLYDPVFDTKFVRRIQIPLSTMNRPGAPAKFNFYDFYLGIGPQWAQLSEPHRALSFWDPQLMYDWVQNVAGGRDFWFRDHSTQREGKSFVLAVDARFVRAPKRAFSFSSPHLKRIQAEVHRLWSSSQ